jgi:hypothetical protein
MRDEEREDHPSYGRIMVSRSQGGPGVLFGSSVEHHHSIRLTVTRASVGRSLHHDWVRGEDELVEVDMTEAQFARMVTSVGLGEGTECTLRYVMGERMPDPPRRDAREKVKQEFRDRLRSLADRTRKQEAVARELLEKKSLSKADRAVILSAIGLVIRELTDSLPFMEKAFYEATEKTTDQAKGEIEAFLALALQKAAQVNPDLPKLLSGPAEVESDEQN